MRLYKQHFDRSEVDLDDPKTYEDLPKDVRTLDDRMFSRIGYALCYMKYFRPEIGWGKKSNDGGQKKRIKKLIKDFCNNRFDHYNDVLWLQEQVFLFEDEIENMC